MRTRQLLAVPRVVVGVCNSRRFAASISSRAQLMLQGSAPPRRPPTPQGGRQPQSSGWRPPCLPTPTSVSVFSGDAGPRGGSHLPVVGLAPIVVCPLFTLLALLLPSVGPSAHLFWLPTLFPSLVLDLVALCILRYPKQFLELLGLFIAHFRQPTSLQARAPRCFLRLNVCFCGLLVGSGGLLCLLGGSSVLVFRLPCPPVGELISKLGSGEVRLPA
jgi:hypothetical protein